MARKKQEIAEDKQLEGIAESTKDALNRTLTDAETGAILIITADLGEILDDINIYTTALLRARQLTGGAELSSGDPLIDYVYRLLFSGLPVAEEGSEEQESRIQEVQSTVLQYYDYHRNKASGEATMLALVKLNIFTKKPTPYPPEEKTLPGIVTIPPPERRLFNDQGVEWRLKQLMDFVEIDNKNCGIQFLNLVQEVGVRIVANLAEREKAGFQSA